MINIKNLIEREAPGDDEHDNAYKIELGIAYEQYKDYRLFQLIEYQKIERVDQDGTHASTARMMVLYELIKNYF